MSLWERKTKRSSIKRKGYDLTPVDFNPISGSFKLNYQNIQTNTLMKLPMAHSRWWCGFQATTWKTRSAAKFDNWRIVHADAVKNTKTFKTDKSHRPWCETLLCLKCYTWICWLLKAATTYLYESEALGVKQHNNSAFGVGGQFHRCSRVGTGWHRHSPVNHSQRAVQY